MLTNISKNIDLQRIFTLCLLVKAKNLKSSMLLITAYVLAQISPRKAPKVESDQHRSMGKGPTYGANVPAVSSAILFLSVPLSER